MNLNFRNMSKNVNTDVHMFTRSINFAVQNQEQQVVYENHVKMLFFHERIVFKELFSGMI